LIIKGVLAATINICSNHQITIGGPITIKAVRVAGNGIALLLTEEIKRKFYKNKK
jgi:hypothetical protein